MLVSYQKDGNDLLTTSPVPNFWRAPTDNDFGANYQIIANVWRRTVGRNYKVVKVEAKDQTRME